MYINMTPDKTNKTLHASQDDTTRQFKFKLINDSQVLDTSDSIPPVIYDVEPNGIEQLLPVNSSTPTTSPIIADIQYPDELREDQEFFERIIPTTLKGQAKIEKIKGNTLVWNQLSGTGKEDRVVNNTTCVANNDGSFTLSTNNETTTAISLYRIIPLINIPTGHKFYLKLQDSELSGLVLRPYTAAHAGVTEGTTTEAILTATKDINYIAFLFNIGTLINGTLTVKPICIDLTLMFGAGNEPTSVSDFTDLFPLPYYNYNAGSLLSFNGTGIKSIGFNQWDEQWELGTINGSGELQPSTTEIRTKNYIQVLPNTSYYVATPGVQVFHYYAGDYSYLGNQYVGNSMALKLPSQTRYVKFRCANTYGTVYKNDICVNISDSSKNGTYEPYIENILQLPISTYFATGMKSAGTIYDELTSSKVITRVGSVDLGSLNWNYTTSGQGRFYSSGISSLVKPVSSNSNIANIKCPIYSTISAGSVYAGITGIAIDTSGAIWVYDASQGTDAKAFKTAMSGVYIYYELATPTEEDIESCSLVSVDIEIPLEYDSGFLVCDSKGLTSKAGFIPCKIKKVKGDETLYSQLINLHVERKP